MAGLDMADPLPLIPEASHIFSVRRSYWIATARALTEATDHMETKKRSRPWRR